MAVVRGRTRYLPDRRDGRDELHAFEAKPAEGRCARLDFLSG